MHRKNQRIVIAKHIDVPENPREYFHNGWQRADIYFISPYAMLDGISQDRFSEKKPTHKFKVLSRNLADVGYTVMWLDKTMPRLFKIVSSMSDPKSDRHSILYAKEILAGEANVYPDTVQNDGQGLGIF